MGQIITSGSTQQSLKPLFKDFFDIDPFFGGSWLQKRDVNMPAVNIAENATNFLVDVVAPGFDKNDFKIKVEEGVLTISAETKYEVNEKEVDYTRREYSFSSFTRSFYLPENVNEDAISARYDNGILKIEMPKTSVDVKASKEVKVQ
ncbi:MAG: Hsp20/alpha crystallin family protein [Bacteroidota bacterium]|nr:Hsp20/alpha crystallin family protein [Bacteroidota bacterium]